MELFIETLTGTGFELRVSPMETVMSVKAKIQRLEGIPVSQQHLIWRSQELADDSLLQDYKITDGATLRLVISMRGGPINTRRVPVEDPTWKEIVDYMESNREEIWEKLPYGRQVTLLVYRDGDQVNFFRVMDRGDGTVVPLSQALGATSLRSAATADRVEDAEQQRIRENNVTMQKMRSIRKQMDALTLSKKLPDSSTHQTAPPTPYGALPVAKTRTMYPHPGMSRPLRLPPVPGGSRMPFSPHQQAFPPRTTGPSAANGGVASGLPRRTPLINVVSARQNRMGQPPRSIGEPSSLLRRPGHKTDAEENDMVRMSTHECRGALPDLRTIPSLHGDGGLLRVETGCGPSGGSGGDLEAPRWSRSSGSVRGNGAVALGMLSSPSAASDLSTRRRLRNPPAHPKSRGAVGGGAATTSAATASTNFDSLEQLQLQTLAKFDPRISVQTSPRASAAARVTLATPSASEAATLTAVGRRRESLALVRGAEVGGARPKSSPADETTRRSTASAVNDDDDDDLSSGVYSVAAPRRSPLVSPEVGGSALFSPSDLCRSSRLPDVVDAFHWKACGASIEPGWGDSSKSSRETSPESGSLGEMNIITKDSSSSFSSSSSSSSVDVSLSQGLVAVARLPVIKVPLPPPRKSETPRCLVCRRKTGLATSYSCRCGGNFCATHRYAETHGCTYDYKTEGRKMIAQSNPLVTASKLPKI